MSWRTALCARMTDDLSAIVNALEADACEKLEEIRIYLGRPCELTVEGIKHTTEFVPDRVKMDELVAALSGYALYRCEEQLSGGYLPLPGGHRAGVCGKMIRDEHGRYRMSGITSICIRIARHVPGASMPIRPYLLTAEGRARHVLFFGAPGCGKTTILRDAALYLSDDAGLCVAAADEREELFASMPAGGGLRLDVFGGCDKAGAISALLRSMAPQVIVTDEIGNEEDAAAIADAMRCGVGVLATAHAEDLSALKQRAALGRLLDAGGFDCCIHLGRRGRVIGVWEADGRHIQ